MNNRSKVIVLSLCLAIAAGAVVGTAISRLRSAPAAAESSAGAASEGQLLAQGNPNDVLARASTKVGFQLRPSGSSDYELVSANVSSPPEGNVDDGVRFAILQYQRLSSAGPRGKLKLVELPFQRDAPISGGRHQEPGPVPVPSTAKGLSIVRVDLPDAVGFTAWFANQTLDVIFAQPTPDEAEMVRIVEGVFK